MSQFQTYPNQRLLKIAPKPELIPGTFVSVPRIDIYYAKKNLTYTAFVIWLTIIGNSDNPNDNFSYAYSPKRFHDDMGVSLSQARKAYDELKEKGFIIDGKIYMRPPANEIELRKIMQKMASEPNFSPQELNQINKMKTPK